MTEKVLITQEQSDAIKGLIYAIGRDEVMNSYAESDWVESANKCLNKLSVSELARVLYEKGGYEIEPEFKVGEWAFHQETGTTSKIVAVGLLSVQTDNCYNFSIYNIRHATLEEIAKEKERRLWKSIGREVGEFREGDIGVYRSGVLVSKLKNLVIHYRSGDIIGFYPTESYVSFYEGEES